ncbi:MAG: M14 metallopeptidase family protein [Acidobacteriota bacterium]
MKRRMSLKIVFILFVAFSIQSDAALKPSAALAQNQNVPAPEEVLGFRPGDDRKLASWSQIVQYFQRLDAASDRVRFQEIGKTTMGAPFVYATISSPENLKRLDEYRRIQDQLADPRVLGSPANPALADGKARALITRGRTVVAITCGIHSTEVGSTLSSTLIAYRLASSNEPEIQEILRNTIILLVPSTNPDGVDIVKNWYDKTLGTPYEGADPPELYHKYVGHDNNRDWYAFTQVETQLVVDKILNVWHPQIVHDIHQQGSAGSRLFLPPYMAPVEPNVPQKIVEGYTELGNYMAKEMRAAGFKGITTNSTYDAWTPARAYSHYHGGVRILSETASAKLATPITMKFEELRARGEFGEGASSQGYDPKIESANFGPVWQGGEWRLRDITNNMTTAAFFLLKHAAQDREHWLQRFFEIGKEAVRPRNDGELYGFKVNVGTNTKPLLDALERGGVEISWPKGDKPVEVTTDSHLGGRAGYPGRVAIVQLSQPYGGFAKALLERQHYPDLRNSSGLPIAPYDVTAHTVPLLMNVDVQPIIAPYKGTFLKRVHLTVGLPDCQLTGNKDVGLYKSAVPVMDEGWTRWVFGGCTEYASLMDAQIRAGNLHSVYRVIIIPDQARNAILEGHRPGRMPPEYTGGLGQEGVKALREFVEQGGTLVCLNRASDFVIEQFKLPIRNVVSGLPRQDFYVPGSILRIELDTSDPIARGMPKESIAWAENSPAFEIRGVSPANADAQAATSRMPVPRVKIIAWYPRDKDPLLSGWLLGGDLIKGKAALVEVSFGKGRIILFGFRPQYRGQSLATYPLFFNAISARN